LAKTNNKFQLFANPQVSINITLNDCPKVMVTAFAGTQENIGLQSIAFKVI
jgi:hypothetical protein